MNTTVKKLAEQVKALPPRDLDEFLSWLAEYEGGQADGWDRQIEQDSRDEGALSPLIQRAREDIAAGRTKPLDEVIDNS